MRPKSGTVTDSSGLEPQRSWLMVHVIVIIKEINDDIGGLKSKSNINVLSPCYQLTITSEGVDS